MKYYKNKVLINRTKENTYKFKKYSKINRKNFRI